MIAYAKKRTGGAAERKLFEIGMHAAGRETFGFRKERGALRCGYGVHGAADAGALPEGKEPAALYRACEGGAYLLVCSDGAAYIGAGGADFTACGITFAREPVSVRVYDGEEALLLSDGERCALLTASGIAEEEGVPPFDCAGYAYERLWLVPAGEGIRLQFSAPADIRGFTEARGAGGSVDVPDEKGDIVAVLPCEGDLLLLRERGGQLLSPRGDEREFSVKDLFSCGKVFPKTAAAAAFGAVFMTEDGLFCWNGKLSAFSEEYACRIAFGADARGAAAGEKYVLSSSVCTAYGGGRALSVFSADGSAVFLRRGAACLTAAGGRAYCVSGGAVCALGERASRGEVFRWVSDGFSPFGARALLCEVRVRAEGEFVLTVRSEDGARSVRVCGGGRVPVRLAGERFRICLEAETPGAVYSVAALCARAEGG